MRTNGAGVWVEILTERRARTWLYQERESASVKNRERDNLGCDRIWRLFQTITLSGEDFIQTETKNQQDRPFEAPFLFQSSSLLCVPGLHSSDFSIHRLALEHHKVLTLMVPSVNTLKFTHRRESTSAFPLVSHLHTHIFGWGSHLIICSKPQWCRILFTWSSESDFPKNIRHSSDGIFRVLL